MKQAFPYNNRRSNNGKLNFRGQGAGGTYIRQAKARTTYDRGDVHTAG